MMGIICFISNEWKSFLIAILCVVFSRGIYSVH